jgi:hypothetical protein
VRAHVFASLLSLFPAVAHAQQSAEAFLDEREHENALRITAEMDPALAFGIGYVRTVPIEIDRYARRLGLHVDLTAILGGTSWDLVGGATLPLFEGPGPNVLLGVDLALKVAQNDVHTALVYGYGASLRPGWYDPVWYVAADVAIHGTFAASVFHRDSYRAQVASARDATYLTGQLALYLGAAVGFHIERSLVLGLRFAWRFAYTFETYAPWYQPYTLDLELAWRF